MVSVCGNPSPALSKVKVMLEEAMGTVWIQWNIGTVSLLEGWWNRGVCTEGSLCGRLCRACVPAGDGERARAREIGRCLWFSVGGWRQGAAQC